MEHSLPTRRSFLGLLGSGAIGALLIGCTGRPDDAGATARFPVAKSDAEWKRRLGPQRFHVLREQGTERAYTSPLLSEKRSGIFHCAGCDQPLFDSKTKYDSGTGWPSFWAARRGAVGYQVDRSLLMVRTEEHCTRCGGHLGHVFDDGPRPTGKRHCINGLALRFRPA